MMPQTHPAYILGVGITKFLKPRQRNDYAELGFEAGVKALLDAHVTYDDVDRGVASYCYGDSTCGQRVFYQFGMTQIPIYNVNNNCASGSTGMVMARDFVSLGAADCVLVVGFEKMAPGSLGSNFADRTDPLDRAMAMNKKNHPTESVAPWAAQMFANAGNEYVQKYDGDPKAYAEVARINHEHSQRNPYSQFQTVYSGAQVSESAMICDPLTKLQCCPTSDGAAAAVVVSEAFLNARPQLRSQAVEIIGQSLVTDSPAAYDGSAMNLVGHAMAKNTVEKALAEARVKIQDIKVVELHDCFSVNAVLAIDAIGLSAPGKAHEYVLKGQTTYGTDAAVVNPSGGLISKGHPLGATGIAQCAELVWHLRGWANNRLVRVNSGQVALQQNAGLGGASVVTILRRADKQDNKELSSAEVARVTGLGYNPAVEAKGFTAEQALKVLSKHRSDWAVSTMIMKPQAAY